MPLTPQSFLLLAHKHFDYLQHDFGFTAADHTGEGWVQSAQVRYDSPKVAITPSWNSRDGLVVGITAKADTFWIRPASSHEFDVQELVQVIGPEALKGAPPVTAAEETATALEAWLGFYAVKLRTCAASLLRGDLSFCEDMLIMRYCKSAKGLPREDYLKIFREETATLSDEERQQIEDAGVSGSPRRLYFLLDEWLHAGKLRGKRFLTALNAFWLQYLQ